jgi:hypothetical protein
MEFDLFIFGIWAELFPAFFKGHWCSWQGLAQCPFLLFWTAQRYPNFSFVSHMEAFRLRRGESMISFVRDALQTEIPHVDDGYTNQN